MISAVSVRRGLPARAASIALATAMQESKIRNLDYGDRDSLGIFQQRPSQGWGQAASRSWTPTTPATTSTQPSSRWTATPTCPIDEAAQEVQRSADGSAYAQHEPDARALASALTGYSPAAFSCEVDEPVASGQQPGPGGLTADAAAVRGQVRKAFGPLPDGGFAPGWGQRSATWRARPTTTAGRSTSSSARSTPTSTRCGLGARAVPRRQCRAAERRDRDLRRHDLDRGPLRRRLAGLRGRRRRPGAAPPRPRPRRRGLTNPADLPAVRAQGRPSGRKIRLGFGGIVDRSRPRTSDRCHPSRGSSRVPPEHKGAPHEVRPDVRRPSRPADARCRRSGPSRSTTRSTPGSRSTTRPAASPTGAPSCSR